MVSFITNKSKLKKANEVFGGSPTIFNEAPIPDTIRIRYDTDTAIREIF